MAQCVHTFTPEYPEFRDYDHKGDDEAGQYRWLLDESVPGVEDGTWSCPHDAVPGHEKCPFHLPVAERPPELDATAAFLDAVAAAGELESREARRRRVQFVDATFEAFDIAGEVLDAGTSHYINLSHADIAGADLRDTVVRQPIRFAHATFEGPSSFRDAVFDGNVGMRDATFTGPARFRGATFRRPFNVKHGTFEDDAWFWYTVFRRHAIFRDTEFRAYAYFRGVDFDNYARFSQAHFHDEAWFKLGEFGDDADFIDAQFDGPHSFVDAEFERTTDFSGVNAGGSMDLSGTHLENLQMTPDRVEGDPQYVDLSESVVEAGELGQPNEGKILYDAERATLGDVAVTTPDSEPVIEHVRLVATTFDGFEFESDDMDPQVAGWRIHEVFDESVLPEERRGPLPPETLRETYLNAKNGAKQVGNTTAVGQFYYKEMTYRRHRLAELVRSGRGDGLRTVFDWLRNATLMAVTGYGEYPLRIVGSSIAVVLGFAGLYDQLGAGETSAIEAVLFSFQSFITFIVGTPPQETTRLVAVASIVEGFTGAFFVALFVYAFTRRLTR
ncbi:pentapeptide repeat-containing protein [Halolamina sp. C58]|uniref:pentapeptide repeat-containing protein n=1 Tax=Halolamina sp. C58 TaxID=3421640 RepID=UPI003EBFD216